MLADRTHQPNHLLGDAIASGMDKKSGLSDLDLRWRRRSGVPSADQHLVGLLYRERILPYGQRASPRPGGTTTTEDVTEVTFSLVGGDILPLSADRAHGDVRPTEEHGTVKRHSCQPSRMVAGRGSPARHRLELRTGGTS
jgi:hypothetical protein